MKPFSNPDWMTAGMTWPTAPMDARTVSVRVDIPSFPHEGEAE